MRIGCVMYGRRRARTWWQSGWRRGETRHPANYRAPQRVEDPYHRSRGGYGADRRSRQYPIGRRGQKGQAVVEFAVVLPVLLLILMGILDFGRLFYSVLTVRSAAREGARYGAVHATDDAGIRQRVRDAAVGLEQDRLTITITPATSQRRVGEPLTVDVTYPFEYVTPIAAITGREQVVRGTVTMRIE